MNKQKQSERVYRCLDEMKGFQREIDEMVCLLDKKQTRLWELFKGNGTISKSICNFHYRVYLAKVKLRAVSLALEPLKLAVEESLEKLE